MDKGRKGKGKNNSRAQGNSVPLGTSKGAAHMGPLPGNIPQNHEELMRFAFKRAMISGNFLDTKFYAYSRRRSSGAVYSPKAVYANGYILRAKEPQYFASLLHSGFGNCSVDGQLDAGFPDEFPSEIDGAGYDSDSDFEDDEEGDETLLPDSSRDHAASSGTSAPPTGSEDGDDDDKPGVNGVNEESQSPAETLAVGGKGRIHLIRTFAFPTWQAFIFYISTGKITFARLKTQTKAPTTPATPTLGDGDIQPASPKSIYKLADQLGLAGLKKLARDDILSKLSTDNILDELFSSLTAQYDEIQELEITFACEQAKDTVAKDLYTWMDSLEAEDLKRSVGMLAKLFQKMASSSPGRPTSCPYCSAGNGHTMSLKCGSCNRLI